MQSTTGFIKVFILLLTGLVGGCASDRPPSGGSVDTSPLQVVFSDPASGTVNVSRDRINLTFNHYLTGRQLLDALVFSPSIGEYDIIIDGRNLEIRPYRPLKTNTTYILTINRNLRDNRGRTFPAPCSIVFSTGSAINTGTIEGTVFNEDYSPADNALVLAFSRPDNAGAENLLQREPDYLVQTESSGAFSFNNISPGPYRVFAVNDRNRDLRYNGETEETGLSSSDIIRANPSGTANVIIRLAGLNSDNGGLVSCKPLERQLLEIRFGRPVNTASFDPEKIKIRHSGSREPVPVISWYSKNRTIYDSELCIVTGRLEQGQSYLISCPENDGSGKTREIQFFPSAYKQVEKPVSITIIPENKSRPAYLDMAMPALGKAVLIYFTAPPGKSALSRSITFSETGIQTKTDISFSLIKIDDRTFALKPAGGFQPGHSYTVSVDPSLFGDDSLKPAKTKPVVSQFTVPTKEETGSISGKCFASGQYVIVEARKSGSPASFCTSALRDRNGTFHYSFPELPPGNYTVSAFTPSASKQPDPYRQWNPGSIEPYQASEPFGRHPETVSVRTRWATENIDIRIPASR